MTVGQGTGLIQWVPATAGLFPVEITVYDTALNTDVQQFVIEVDPDFVAPRITLTAQPASLNAGGTTTLSVALEGTFDPATLALTVDGTAVALDANQEAVYTALASGAHLAVATETRLNLPMMEQVASSRRLMIRGIFLVIRMIASAG